jgi:hypothetical protein
MLLVVIAALPIALVVQMRQAAVRKREMRLWMEMRAAEQIGFLQRGIWIVSSE